MARSGFWRSAAAAGIFALAGGEPVLASDAAVKAFQGAVYTAKFADGVNKLDTMERVQPNDTEAVFGAGALRFFGAIANLQKDLYAHSTKISGQGKGGRWARGLVPFAGAMGGTLLVPPNPNATPMTYTKLRRILKQFADGIAEAERTLARVGDRPVKLPLRPFDIAIDLNHDGKVEQRERILANLLNSGRRRMRAAVFEAELAFDTADASWLRGYSHVLMACVNFILAFDFEKSYDVGAHNVYGDAATAFGALLAKQANLGRPREVIQAELDKVQADLKAMRREQISHRDIRQLRKHLKELPDTPQNADQRKLYQETLKTMMANQKRHREALSVLYKEQRRLHRERDGDIAGWIYDAVAFIHTLSWDVAEPNRLRAARQHLLRVMELNRNTWRLARLETDDDREWLPNAKQTPPFGAKPDMVTDKIIDSWLATTALAEQVLKGEKLIPHPRFKKGINLRRLLDGAKRMDLILLVTGHDLVPYLEGGDIVDEKAWTAITRPMGRQVGQYAIWFN